MAVRKVGLLLFFVFSQAVVPQELSETISVQMPNKYKIISGQLACNVIASTTIWQKTQEPNTLQGTVKQSDYNVAINVKEKTVIFITDVSVGIGIAEPAEFLIVLDSNRSLTAIYISGSVLGNSLDTLVLNKENGHAVWTKSRVSSIFYKTPEVQSMYMNCR